LFQGKYQLNKIVMRSHWVDFWVVFFNGTNPFYGSPRFPFLTACLLALNVLNHHRRKLPNLDFFFCVNTHVVMGHREAKLASQLLRKNVQPFKAFFLVLSSI
jgi:hypothetical protein